MRIAIAGAGVAGLASATALAAQGHTVHLFERDAAPERDTASQVGGGERATRWARPGVPQMRHSHAFLARLRNGLRDRAPDVLESLLEAGAEELHFGALLPAEIAFTRTASRPISSARYRTDASSAALATPITL